MVRHLPAKEAAQYMCLSVRVALTPPCVQVMERNTYRFQEPGFAGSTPALCTIYTPLAQLEEHLTLNQGVMGSSPIRRTSYAFSSVGRAPDF